MEPWTETTGTLQDLGHVSDLLTDARCSWRSPSDLGGADAVEDLVAGELTRTHECLRPRSSGGRRTAPPNEAATPPHSGAASSQPRRLLAYPQPRRPPCAGAGGPGLIGVASRRAAAAFAFFSSMLGEADACDMYRAGEAQMIRPK